MDDFLDTLGKMMCSARDGGERTSEAEEALAEAKALSLEELEGRIGEIQRSIEENNGRIAELHGQLKNLPTREMLSGKGLELKDEVAELVSQNDSYKVRLQVFMTERDKLRKSIIAYFVSGSKSS